MPPQIPSPGDGLLSEQLEAIYRASLDAIMTFDMDGTIRTANAAAHEMFGYTPEELHDRGLRDLMPEEYLEAEAASLARDGTTSAVQLVGRVVRREGRRADGSVVPFTAYVQRLTVAPPHRYILVAEDMTVVSKAHRRILELHEQLREANRELERRVGERTAQYERTARALATANNQLALEVRERKQIAEALQHRETQLEKLLYQERELSELRSRFVSMASHEFRTPLTAMLSSAEVIAMASEDPPPIVDKHIHRIRQNIAYLRTILEDFLQLGKLDVKGADLRIALLDLPDFFQDTVQELRLISPPGQALRLSTSGELGKTRHADNGLRIILNNLVGNAIKYSPAGTAVELTAARKRDRLVITVDDEGIGIPPEERAMLFERFFRAANATHIQGTGLGLHITCQYVRAMGGTIETEANPGGRGTRFTVDLPYELPPAHSPQLGK